MASTPVLCLFSLDLGNQELFQDILAIIEKPILTLSGSNTHLRKPLSDTNVLNAEKWETGF